MPTPADPRGRSRLLTVVVATALVAAVSACSQEEAPESVGPPQSAPPPRAEDGGLPVPPNLAKGLDRALDRRATSLLDGDREAFTTGLDQTAPGFVEAQQDYFDNLAQLPLGTFSYELDRESLVRSGDTYWVVVEVRLELDGFDEAPVLTRDRFRFAPGAKSGRLMLSSVTDRAWEEANDVRDQPWDTVPIEVRTGSGVLAIFDEGSVAAATPLVRSVELGISNVATEVPYDWSQSVVVYALSDTAFLSSLDNLPGGDPETVDGVAFPVKATPDGNQVVSTRLALHPRMLESSGLVRDRLVRHEITHVAMGRRDDRAPIWLSEGIAEYVSVQPLAPQDRRITEVALAAAKAGVTDLPVDKTFNDADSATNYGLSWWVCEYLAATYGPGTLWTLLEELDGPAAQDSERLDALLGLTSGQLARQGAELLIAKYDPAALEPAPEPTFAPFPEPTPSDDTPSVPPD